jgi:hypothetical protein
MALKQRGLPSPDRLMDVVLDRLKVKESAVAEFCRKESIEFVSLTQPLRQVMAEGRQVYLTYNQHWTPIGHEIAAETLAHYLPNKDTPTGR